MHVSRAAAAGAALPGLAFSLQVTPGAMPAAVNEATVATPGDWNPANNYVLDELPVQPVVDLSLEVSASKLFAGRRRQLHLNRLKPGILSRQRAS